MLVQDLRNIAGLRYTVSLTSTAATGRHRDGWRLPGLLLDRMYAVTTQYPYYVICLTLILKCKPGSL